jgi:uncharacterized protein YegL
MSVQEIVAIVDRSGSMRGKEADTVGGINVAFEEIRKNKKEEDTIRVSLKLFDNEEILKWRREDINSVGDFPLNEFIPRGSTALLDALGNTLTYFMEMKLKDPKAYTSCLIYVVTDGLENSSNHYTRDKIKELVTAAEKNYDITLIYLGANQDAILEASNLGISQDRAMNYAENCNATQAAYRAVGRVASCSRERQSVHFTPAERSMSCEHSTSQNVSPLPPPPRARRPISTPNTVSPAPPLTEAEQHAFLDIAKAYEFDKVKELIALNTGYVNATPAGRWSVLHQAAYAGDVGMIKWLLDHGADISVLNNDGQTPKTVAANAECALLLEPSPMPSPPSPPPPSPPPTPAPPVSPQPPPLPSRPPPLCRT